MAQAQYTVTINDDGSVTTKSTPIEDGISRQATTFDIYQTSKELVSEIENRLLADRIAASVAARLNPQEPTYTDKIKDALNDRGIETP